MTTKKPTQPKPKSKPHILLTQEQKDQKAINKLLGPNAGGASALANQMFGAGSAGRVTTGFDANGNRIGENQDILDQMKAQANFYQVPGQNRSAELTDALGQAKDLTQGYAAPEMQAMREQASKGINQQYNTQYANLAKNQARGGVHGAAAIAQQNEAGNNRVAQQSDLEQGLFAKGADFKAQQIQNYGNMVGQTENTEFGRQQQTGSAYAQQLAAQRSDELNRQQINLGQVAAEKAGQYGTLFGGLGLAQQNKNLKNQNKYNQNMLKLAQQQAAHSGGGGGGGMNIDGYIQAIQGLYSK